MENQQRCVSIRSRRSACGQAMATADLLILIPVSLLLLLFVVNAGVSAFYKEKLGFVTNQSAKYAATLPNSVNPEPQTQVVARGLLRALGMTDPQPNIDVKRVNVAGQPGVQVKVTVSLPLIQGSSVLPRTIVLQDSSTALASASTGQIGQLFHFDRTTNRPIYLPVVKGDSSLPTFFCDEPAGLNPYLGPGVP